MLLLFQMPKKKLLTKVLKITPKINKLAPKIPLSLVFFVFLLAALALFVRLWFEIEVLKKNQLILAQKISQTTQQLSRLAQQESLPGKIPTGVLPPVTEKDHLKGKIDAPVKIVEYSDLECPFCLQFNPTVKQVVAEFSGQVVWVYRHYPLSFHTGAFKEAEATECANELGGNNVFWQYVDKIFEKTSSNGASFTPEQLSSLAGEIGLNQTTFQFCLESGRYTQHVNGDITGGETVGVDSTPTTIILAKDGSLQILSGALPADQLKQSIQEALNK